MSMAFRVTTLTAVFFTLLAVQSAEGFTTYRCGNKIVSVGDHKLDVEAKCGQPVSKEVVSEVTEKIKSSSQESNKKELSKKELIEEWRYDLRNGWWDVLTFRGSKLAEIMAVRKAP